jgi:5-methylcytosine-specific restriction endonuclease McrA
MAFSDSVKDSAFQRSGGVCECRRSAHTAHSSGRCATVVLRHTAEYHHVTAASVGGSDSLSNCEVLCLTCHKLTDSYGR